MRKTVLIAILYLLLPTVSTLFLFKVSARTPVLIFTPVTGGGCSIADLNTAITSAVDGTSDYQDGDVVFMKPDCAATWNSQFTLNNRKITIMGDGICLNCGTFSNTYSGSTIITNAAVAVKSIDWKLSKSRMSGLTINLTTGNDDEIYVQGQGWRFDNLKMDTSVAGKLVCIFEDNKGASTHGYANIAWGLIDHMNWLNCRNYYQADINETIAGSEEWLSTSPLILGNQYNGSNAPIIYLENITCIHPTGSTNNCTDEQYGAREVLRFGALRNGHPEMHSMQGTGPGGDRATRSLEFYATTIDAAGGSCHFDAALLRGGLPIVFSNTLTTSSGGSWCDGNPMHMDNVRSFQGTFPGGAGGATFPQGSCQGNPTANSDWDENASVGYHCRDQISMSDDIGSFPPWGSGQLIQVALFSNNLKPSASNNPSVVNCGAAVKTNGSCHDIQSGRDFLDLTSAPNKITTGTFAAMPALPCTTGDYYMSNDTGTWDATGSHKELIYKCVAAAWTLFYTPYQYPHPKDNTQHVVLETAADGSGSKVSAQSIAIGNSITIYPIVRTDTGAFVSNEAGTWQLAYNSAGIVGGDLVVAGNTKSAVFTPHGTGTTYIGLLDATNNATVTGLLTATGSNVVSIETQPDGTGIVLSGNVTAGSSVTGYCIQRTSGGTFLANEACTWTLINKTGGIADSDLVPSVDQKSAVFTGHLIGVCNAHVVDGSGSSANSGGLNVIAGAAASTKVETMNDGTGSVVPPQTIGIGSAITVYSISRDAQGNFIANVVAVWSLTNKTGGVVDGDLVPAGTNKNAVMTGHAAGSANITAVANTFTGNSGKITVFAPAGSGGSLLRVRP